MLAYEGSDAESENTSVASSGELEVQTFSDEENAKQLRWKIVGEEEGSRTLILNPLFPDAEDTVNHGKAPRRMYITIS
jgi:hypothetical protein